MHYNQTQHALNRKERDAIVYVDAFGETSQVTAETLGQAEFTKWKEWSDENYHDEAKEEHIYKNHTISLESLCTTGCIVPDRETLMIEAEERRDREALRAQVALGFFTCLTETQQARIWLYAIEGFTTREIATLENVSQKSIVISIAKARKNILNFLEKGGIKTRFCRHIVRG